MALQTTYSGDLTTSIAATIFDIISDAKGEKEKATKEAEKYGVDVNLHLGSLLQDLPEIDLLKNCW